MIRKEYMQLWYLLIFYSFNVLALDCMQIKQEIMPPKSVKEYQNKLLQCQHNFNINPNVLGGSVSNWGISSANEFMINECRDHFSYIEKDLDKVLEYSPSRFFKEEIEYLVTNSDKKFEAWADLMRIEAIANLQNASCENTGESINLNLLSNCNRFSKGISEFKCSDRQKKLKNSSQYKELFKFAKAILKLNKKKFKLQAKKVFLQMQIDSNLKVAGEIFCGDKHNDTPLDLVYSNYQSEYRNVINRAQRIKELKLKRYANPFDQALVQREIDALEYMDQYELQINQMIEDQTSDNPEILIKLEVLRENLKEINKTLEGIDEKILLAFSVQPLLFVGIDENKKLLDHDLEKLFPLSVINNMATEQGIEKLEKDSIEIYRKKNSTVIDKICNANEIDVHHLLGMSEIRAQVAQMFPTYEALSSCIETKVEMTKMIETTASILGCTIGSVIPMTSLYTTTACAGYFVSSATSQYFQSIDNLKLAADCRSLDSDVCSQENFDKAFSELKTSYEGFIFSLITDVGLEAIGLGAFTGLKKIANQNGKNLKKTLENSKAIFIKIHEASKISDKQKRIAAYKDILNIDINVSIARSSISKTHGTHPKYSTFVKKYGELSQSVSPKFARAHLEGNFPIFEKLLNILKTSDPSFSRSASELFMQFHNMVDPELLIKLISEAALKKLSPQQLMQTFSHNKMISLASSKNPNLLMSQYLQEIRLMKSKRVAKDIYLLEYAAGDEVRSAGVFLQEPLELSESGGMRQLFQYDDSPSYNKIRFTSFDGDYLNNYKFMDNEGITHGLRTPHLIIKTLGEDVADKFMGISRFSKNTYLIGDVGELNANIERFNSIVGLDSPLRIDFNFYYSGPISIDEASKTSKIYRDQVTLASQKTIDRIASGFEWPMGNRDVYQVHDIGTHTPLLLMDRKAMAVAQKKAQDFVELRDFVDTLDTTAEIKESVKYVLNTFAGDKFEEFGVLMDYVFGFNSDYGLINNLNQSSRGFLAELVSKLRFRGDQISKTQIPTEIIQKLSERVELFDSTRHSFTKEGLLEIAEQKLKVVRENF